MPFSKRYFEIWDKPAKSMLQYIYFLSFILRSLKALPFELNYTSIKLADVEGFEPPTKWLTVTRSTTELYIQNLAIWVGLEPTTCWLTANCSTIELPNHILNLEDREGFEPSTTWLTVRRSNQLSYLSKKKTENLI